jgi:L-ascorbate 6-phosphate lactonase
MQSPISDWGTSLRDEIEGATVASGIRFWWLGGASFAFKTPSATVYLDLYTDDGMSSGIKKMIATVIDPNDIRVADALVCTHDHLDHCWPPSFKPLIAGTSAQFIGPVSCVKLFGENGVPESRIALAEPGKAIQVKDFEVLPLKATDPGEAHAVCYLFRSGGVTIFASGDSQYSDIYAEFGKQFKVDLALVNFGTTWYMNAEQAVKTAAEVGAKTLVPFHYDLWKGATGNPHLVPPAARDLKLDLEVKLLELGDSVELPGA